MHSLVKDLMTTPVVTVEPPPRSRRLWPAWPSTGSARFRWVDDDNRVLGVVSEADLLLQGAHAVVTFDGASR